MVHTVLLPNPHFGGVMARKEATTRKAKTAPAMREVLEQAKAVDLYTADPSIENIVADKSGTEGQKLNQATRFLIEAAGSLPRKMRTTRERLARAELESVRGAAEIFEF